MVRSRGGSLRADPVSDNDNSRAQTANGAVRILTMGVQWLIALRNRTCSPHRCLRTSAGLVFEQRDSPSDTVGVLVVVFPQFHALDLTGPLDVFALASDAPRVGTAKRQGYSVALAAPEAGALRSSSGLTVLTGACVEVLPGSIDTMIVAGGEGARRVTAGDSFLQALGRAALGARRVAAIGTGAFVLGELGLLDGRRATTHWLHAEELARRFPRVTVQGDAVFMRDGPAYTSAGAAAGIDLALALVEEDFGREVASCVARGLVVFARRCGGEPQLSAHLAAQVATTDGLRVMQKWVVDHPEADLSIESCARRAGMSPRNFARVFVREIGTTPATWIEAVRVERAQLLLASTARGIDEIASLSGFRIAESMRRAFHRRLHVSPATYRQRFRP